PVRYRPSYNGRKIRSRSHRPLRSSGRGDQRYRCRDRAGTFQIRTQPQRGADAYEFYQRAMWHLYRYTKEDSIEAQAYFRRALAIDPRYPQATAFSAIIVCNAAYLGWAEDVERNYVEAYELAQRAVALDPRYPAARFALGLVCMWTSRSDQAIAAFHEAIRL